MNFGKFPLVALAPSAVLVAPSSLVFGAGHDFWEEGLRSSSIPPSLAHARRQVAHHRVLCEQIEAILAGMETVLFRSPPDEPTRKSHEGFLAEEKGRIAQILESSRYQMGFMGFTPSANDQTRVQVGRNMNQSIVLHWGLLNRETLGWDALSLKADEGDRRRALDLARKTLGSEKAMLDAMSVRLEQVAVFQVTAEKAARLSDVWDLKPGDEGLLESALCTTAGDYLSRTVDCLRRIRVLAGQGLPMIDGQVKPGLFETYQLVAEMDRIASHGSFGGMNILTGRFQTNAGASWMGPLEMSAAAVSVSLPDATARGIFNEAPTFGFIEDTRKEDLIRRCLAAENTLEAAMAQLDGAAKKLDGSLPLPTAPVGSLLAKHGVFTAGKMPPSIMGLVGREQALTAARYRCLALRTDVAALCDSLYAAQEGKRLIPKVQQGMGQFSQSLRTCAEMEASSRGFSNYRKVNPGFALSDLAGAIEKFGGDSDMVKRGDSGLGLLDWAYYGMLQSHAAAVAERDLMAFRHLVAKGLLGPAEASSLCIAEAKSWARLATTPVISMDTRARIAGMVRMWLEEGCTLDSKIKEKLRPVLKKMDESEGPSARQSKGGMESSREIWRMLGSN